MASFRDRPRLRVRLLTAALAAVSCVAAGLYVRSTGTADAAFWLGLTRRDWVGGFGSLALMSWILAAADVVIERRARRR